MAAAAAASSSFASELGSASTSSEKTSPFRSSSWPLSEPAAEVSGESRWDSWLGWAGTTSPEANIVVLLSEFASGESSIYHGTYSIHTAILDGQYLQACDITMKTKDDRREKKRRKP